MLVGEIAVTANTYEETKRILPQRYLDLNRIIQAHLEFLDSLPPAKSASSDELTTNFIECHPRVQALRTLGEMLTVKGGC